MKSTPPSASARPEAGTPPPRAPRERNRPETTARILGAVGEVLARDGFGALGVNAVAKHAGVDKVLIYRYFGGMPELLRAWGESGRFWPGVDELLGADREAFLRLPLAERYARFFEHFIDGLRARPLTLEIMAAELGERNELTAILETEREEWGAEAGRVLGGDAWAERPALRGITLLLVAGVQYLLVRSRTIRVFGGLDIRSDRDWGALKAAVRDLANAMLCEPAPGRSPRKR
ncbi:MAG TPA: helix-turn-helix domain-containing protein [Caldimonas sp.]